MQISTSPVQVKLRLHQRFVRMAFGLKHWLEGLKFGQYPEAFKAWPSSNHMIGAYHY